MNIFIRFLTKLYLIKFIINHLFGIISINDVIADTLEVKKEENEIAMGDDVETDAASESSEDEAEVVVNSLFYPVYTCLCIHRNLDIPNAPKPVLYEIAFRFIQIVSRVAERYVLKGSKFRLGF